MKKGITAVAFIMLVALTVVFPFSMENSRAVSLCYALTASARGVDCIGFNPANLALSGSSNWDIMILGGVNYFFSNNAFSLESYSRFAGRNVGKYGDDTQGDIVEMVPDEGWNVYSNLGIPVLRVSFGNKALSSDLFYLREYNLSKSIFEVVFGEMKPGEEYRYDVQADEIIAFKHGFSVGVPFGKLCIGVTISYIQALSGFRVDPWESTGYIMVDTLNFALRGEGKFRLMQYTGGEGFAVDLGLLCHDLYGWDIGVSFINVGGVIRYNSEQVLSRLFGGRAARIIERNFNKTNRISTLQFDNTGYEYTFILKDVSIEKLLESDSTLEDFITGKGTLFVDQSKPQERIPLALRMGVFRKWGYLGLSTDFIATFDTGFIFRKGWQFAMGFEYDRGWGFPLRTGFSIGGIRGICFGLGSGIRKGILAFDWGVNFHRGILIHKLKGIDLSFNLGIRLSE